MLKFISLIFILLLIFSQNIYANVSNWLDSDNSEIENNDNLVDFDNSDTENNNNWLDSDNNKIEDNNWLDSDNIGIENNSDYKNYNIDFGKVKEKWLDLNNSLRKDLWKSEYRYDDKLDGTAQEWSKVSKQRWNITHKRDKKDSYYNYSKITSWFKNRWVECKNVNRSTFSESIWYGNYSCKWDNCTRELENWIERVFNMYVKEKNKKYKPHYKALISDQFKNIWLWLSITEIKGNSYEFYLTVHYCTEVL